MAVPKEERLKQEKRRTHFKISGTWYALTVANTNYLTAYVKLWFIQW